MTDQVEVQEVEEQEIPTELDEALTRQFGTEEVAPTEAPEPPEEPPTEEEPTSETPQEPSGVEETPSPGDPLYDRFRAWVDRNPEAAEQIGAWERGEAVLVPRQALESWQQAAQAPAPQEEPTSFYDDPEGHFRRLEERYQALEADYFQKQQEAQSQAMQQNAQLIQTFASDFRSKHPELTDEQFMELTNEVTASGRVARYVAQHGDRAKALREAYEREHRAMFPGPSQEDQLRAQRQKRRAGAAASSPRPANRNAPPEAPKTKQERIQAAADLIREAREANA